tara:strand:- start:151 stop:696 length:546 start_codon:yes stop_codon:yes gene_type:complete
MKKPTKQSKRTRSVNKPDGRSPVIKSILTMKKTHPTDLRRLKQVRELNGNKKRYSTEPLKQIRLASSGIRTEAVEPKMEDNLLQERLEIIKEIGRSSLGVITERRTMGTVAGNSWSSRHGKTRPVKPGNSPERRIVAGARHEKKGAALIARKKMSSANARQQYDQAQRERDQETSTINRIT